MLWGFPRPLSNKYLENTTLKNISFFCIIVNIFLETIIYFRIMHKSCRTGWLWPHCNPRSDAQCMLWMCADVPSVFFLIFTHTDILSDPFSFHRILINVAHYVTPNHSIKLRRPLLCHHLWIYIYKYIQYIWNMQNRKLWRNEQNHSDSVYYIITYIAQMKICYTVCTKSCLFTCSKPMTFLPPEIFQ